MTKNHAAVSGAKIFLRRPQESDFRELAELYNASREHLRGFASTLFDETAFGRTLAEAENDTYEYFLICRNADTAIAGTINLSQIFRKSFQNAYLGYMLGANFTGFGYMSEAVALTLDFAFGQLKLHRVEANVQPVNLPSIRVLQRNNFTKEGFSRRYIKIGGRWRDHERWAIIKEDWKPHEVNDLTSIKNTRIA